MKKILFIVLTVIISIIIIVVSIFSMMFFGTPWERIYMRIKSDIYLKEKYDEKMVLTHTVYDPVLKYYAVFAYPENNKEIEFFVTKRNKATLEDTYIQEAILLNIEEDICEISDNVLNLKVEARVGLTDFIINFPDKYRIPPQYSEVSYRFYDKLYIFIDINELYSEDIITFEFLGKIFNKYYPTSVYFEFRDHKQGISMKDFDTMNASRNNP